MTRDVLQVHGNLAVPGDKSISHRAVMLAALSSDVCMVRGCLTSADVHSTRTALSAMGWELPAIDRDMRIDGGGFHPTRSGSATLDCGNSGTTTRLLSGVAAAQSSPSIFVGDDSLSRRPMQRVADPLRAMGANVHWLGDEGRLPMAISGGALHAAPYELTVASAQVKSAILLAGLVGQCGARVRETVPTRDHTERMLRMLGAHLVHDRDGWIRLDPLDVIPGFELDVPGDPSSAAFFAVLAGLATSGTLRLEGVLLNEARTGFIRVLRRMQVQIEIENQRTSGAEEVGDLVVTASAHALRGTSIEPHEVPSLIDELPILAVLAARAAGETRVRGAEELRGKESDRITALVTGLRAVGVLAEEQPDGFIVSGGSAPLVGAVETHHDHRLAMAFGVLGATPRAQISLDDSACVNVSYPTFWSDLARVTK